MRTIASLYLLLISSCVQYSSLYDTVRLLELFIFGVNITFALWQMLSELFTASLLFS